MLFAGIQFEQRLARIELNLGMCADNDSHTNDALGALLIIESAYAITPECFIKDMQTQLQRIHNQLEAQVEAAVRSTGGLNRHRVEQRDAKGREAYQSSEGYCLTSRLSAKRFGKGSESRTCEYHEEKGKGIEVEICQKIDSQAQHSAGRHRFRS